MASDEDYSAFLDKANEDPNNGTAKTQSSSGKVQLKAVDQGANVPAVLKKATKDAFYVSDADEPFEPVCLKLAKGKSLPDEGTCSTVQLRLKRSTDADYSYSQRLLQRQSVTRIQRRQVWRSWILESGIRKVNIRMS